MKWCRDGKPLKIESLDLQTIDAFARFLFGKDQSHVVVLVKTFQLDTVIMKDQT
jgi:hypothetical protein